MDVTARRPMRSESEPHRLTVAMMIAEVSAGSVFNSMALLADGSLILSMPNFNELKDGARLMRITAENQVEDQVDVMR